MRFSKILLTLLPFIALVELTSAVAVKKPKKKGTSKSSGKTSTKTPSAKAPTISLDPKNYPIQDKPIATDTPQVKEWLKLVDFSKVPSFPLSKEGNCPDDDTKVDPKACWWTCTKCVVPEDIVVCPDKNTFGVTYDDGPSTSTPKLLDFLGEKNLSSTFFVVGSRVLDNPEVLRRAFDSGHHIAIHTWGHPALTSISNEAIVAELMWTEKIIRDVIGMSPIYYRPPFGDVDNRVRSIASQLGFKTVIWTEKPVEFDTNDWKIPEKTSKPETEISILKNFIAQVPKMDTGFLVLEHDLFPQTVDIAVNSILPAAISANLTLKSMASCVNDPTPYKELLAAGANNTSNAAPSSAAPATETTPAAQPAPAAAAPQPAPAAAAPQPAPAAAAPQPAPAAAAQPAPAADASVMTMTMSWTPVSSAAPDATPASSVSDASTDGYGGTSAPAPAAAAAAA